MTLADTTAAVAKMAGAADSIGSTIKFAFKGGEGVIYLDGSGDPNSVSNENKSADCTVTIDFQDFNDLISGNLNPMGAFMSGKLKIDGDLGVAMKLSSLFG
ncbi:MAG: SCP2 sterol-binding domain-containing protein [Bacteroidia bacterium]|nr:SCP2 sterol-binding domain-containing protein [Bacteroidia bacterium]